MRRQDPDVFNERPDVKEFEMRLIETSLQPARVSDTSRGALSALQTAIREVSRNDPDKYNADSTMRANHLKLIEAGVGDAGRQPENNHGQSQKSLTDVP